MFAVIENVEIAPALHRLRIVAPRVAQARAPGQFVIVRAAEGAERIPLTIGDADAAAGTIDIFVQALGTGTRRIVAVPAGGALQDVAGPLGQPTHLQRWGKAVCVGGGVGTAVLYPLAHGLADAGNRVTAIVGGRSAGYCILRQELAAFCDEVRPVTEDGSLGRRGRVTDELAAMLADPAQRPNVVFAVGPLPMMRAVAELTRSEAIPTIVSLNPIMIDGTGMCGGCRVTVAGETRFACLDGPEFDAHQVDFASLEDRLSMYLHDGAGCRLAGDRSR